MDQMPTIDQMANAKLTLFQLEQDVSIAAWILKGPVDASDYKVYIFPLLFFKRILKTAWKASQEAEEKFKIALSAFTYQ